MHVSVHGPKQCQSPELAGEYSLKNWEFSEKFIVPILEKRIWALLIGALFGAFFQKVHQKFTKSSPEAQQKPTILGKFL